MSRCTGQMAAAALYGCIQYTKEYLPYCLDSKTEWHFLYCGTISAICCCFNDSGKSYHLSVSWQLHPWKLLFLICPWQFNIRFFFNAGVSLTRSCHHSCNMPFSCHASTMPGSYVPGTPLAYTEIRSRSLSRSSSLIFPVPRLLPPDHREQNPNISATAVAAVTL